MSRSQTVREEALRLDGYRCQICGADKRTGAVLEVHHVDPLGIGGSDERDTVENAITLCGLCHVKVGNGQLFIEKWDRDAAAAMRRGGAAVPCLEVYDADSRKIPHEQLWFYRRKEAEELEGVEESIHGVHRADGGVAYALWRLWNKDAFKALDPDAKSFKAYCEARDWRTTSCVEMAETYSLSKENDFEWLEDETMRAFKGRARAKGLIGNREYHYVMIPPKSWLTGARPEVYYRTAHEQALRDTMDIGARLYKIGKTVYGLRAEGGDLIDPEGRKVDVIHFVPKGA